VDSIADEPDKTLIKYKADIYAKLADKYYNLGDYEGAIDRYDKSLFYWKINGNKKEIAYVQNSLASSYVYLADENVNEMQPQDAINSLKNVLTMFDVPILKYKLALLLMTKDPESANQYFEEVFKEAPELINYDTYYNFLSVMADYANSIGDTAQAQLYKYKQKKIKEFFETNVLSIDDIVLEDVKGRITSNNWFQKNNIYLEAKLNNVSKNTIDSLFIEIVFKDKEKVIGDYTEQIVDKKSRLLPGRYSPLISIKISVPKDLRDAHPKTITADIYASKTATSLKLHLTTVGIKEKIKPKQPNKFLLWFGRVFDKITSKLPSFLF
jgi:tetratricopeptide (TPR) repeat protein